MLVKFLYNRVKWSYILFRSYLRISYIGEREFCRKSNGFGGFFVEYVWYIKFIGKIKVY